MAALSMWAAPVPALCMSKKPEGPAGYVPTHCERNVYEFTNSAVTGLTRAHAMYPPGATRRVACLARVDHLPGCVREHTGDARRRGGACTGPGSLGLQGAVIAMQRLPVWCAGACSWPASACTILTVPQPPLTGHGATVTVEHAGRGFLVAL